MINVTAFTFTLENLYLRNLNQYLSHSGSILSLLLFKWKPSVISFLIDNVPCNFCLGPEEEKKNLCKIKFKGKQFFGVFPPFFQNQSWILQLWANQLKENYRFKLTFFRQNSQILFEKLSLREYLGIKSFFQSIKRHPTFPLKFSFSFIRKKLQLLSMTLFNNS